MEGAACTKPGEGSKEVDGEGAEQGTWGEWGKWEGDLFQGDSGKVWKLGKSQRLATAPGTGPQRTGGSGREREATKPH